jgi:hypothetical protein
MIATGPAPAPFTRLHKRDAWPDRIKSRRQRSPSTAPTQRPADTDRRKRIFSERR